MKKSELFKKAQISVMKDVAMSAEERLEIIRVLANEQDIAECVEKRNAEKEASENV